MAWPKGKKHSPKTRSQIASSMRATKQSNPGRFGEIGDIGIRRGVGRIADEFIRELAGNLAIKQYREMRDNDAIVGAFLFAIESLIRNVTWRIEPSDTDNAAIEAAAFVEQCLDDMSVSWDDAISDMLTMLPYGYSYHEIVYKRRGGTTQDPTSNSKFDDGRIGWRKLPIRSQQTLARWMLDESGGVQGFVQRPPMGGAERVIPINKALLFKTTSNRGNPEGRSILRNAWRSWLFKKRIEEIEGIGIERDLAGLPVCYVPSKIMASTAPAADKAIFDAIKDIVVNIRRDEQEGIVMPGDRDENGNPMYELKLLTTGGQRQFDTDKVIQRYDQRIAVQVLADFILIGHEKVGSFSLSSDKTSMFSTAIGSFMKQIAETMNRHAIPRLMVLNGIPLEMAPKLMHGDVEVPNLQELGDYIAKLSGAGMELFPDQAVENKLRSYGGLPEKPEWMVDEEMARIEDGPPQPPPIIMPPPGNPNEPPGDGSGQTPAA